MASPVGLFKWDASSVSHWGRNRGLQCNGLRSVAVDAYDRVWVGTDLGLEVLDIHGNARAELDSIGWRFGLCQYIAVSANQLWLGTAQGLVQLVLAVGTSEYTIEFCAEVGFVNHVFCLASDRVLAATVTSGLIETDGKTWWNYRCEAIREHKISHVVPGLQGRLLVGTDAGLFVIEDSNARVIAQLAPPQHSPTVTAIAVGCGQYWIAFGRRLMGYDANGLAYDAAEQFMVESSINDLWVDTLGNVWIATNNSGLCQVSCLRHALERIDLGHSGGVYAIKPAAHDHYTICGDRLFGDAVLGFHDRGASLQGPDGLPETIVWDALVDAAGTWAATQFGLYYAKPDSSFVHMFAQHAVLGAPSRVVLTRGAETWVGSLGGLACIQDGMPRIVEGDGAPLGYVYAMVLDDRGRLWIGTLGRGLWCEHNGLSAVTAAPLTADGNTYAIAQGPGGDMAIVQDEKVVLLDRLGASRLVVDLPPVAGWCLLWLDARTIALGASDGLRIVDVTSGHVARHVQALLPLRGWEFTNSRTLALDGEGRLLCGLSSGLLRVDLAQLNVYTPPVCKLSTVAWRGVNPTRKGSKLQVSPGLWSFHLTTFAAWFVDYKQVRFQFQLVGFDRDWSELDDRPDISYTSLPPGSYRLMARAYAPLTGFGPDTELLRLLVKRPLWAMGWAAALASMEALYGWAVRSRTRNLYLIRTNRQLERAVADRTASLRLANQELQTTRDDYQRLSEVDALTQLGNRRHFDREIVRNTVLASRLEVPLALMIVDVDHFKAVNDLYGHPIGDEYLRAVGGVFGQVIRAGQDIATRFGGEEFAILLMKTGSNDVLHIAEKVRAAVATLALPNEGSTKGYLTVSIGVAVSQIHQWLTPEELFAQADRALYRAKRNGRDQVTLAITDK
jgi:diguanylate cyclase (GGDEF)-like protein